MKQSVQCESNISNPSIVSPLGMRAERQPCRVAYTSVPDCGEEQKVSYSELRRQVTVIACKLTEMALQGQSAMLLYPSGPGFVTAFFGCLYACQARPSLPPSGPDFAYELCVQKATAAQRAQLDLSSWRVEFNGSELIRPDTMENFTLAFEPAGFSRDSFHPYYGLAEATLIVTGSRRGVKAFDATRSRCAAAASGAVGTSSLSLVRGGFAAGDRDAVIVDPDMRVERTAGRVGQIWKSGRGVAPSSWHRPPETRRIFPVRLASTSEASRAAAAATKVPAVASLQKPTVADKAPVRLYRWISGSRVPADAGADAGSFLDPAGRRPGERPRWAS